MSDISKKILSIDPVDVDTPVKTGRPALQDGSVPEFVTRQSSIFTEEEEQSTGRWIIWFGLLLNLLWISGCVAYVLTRPDLSIATMPPLDLAGLAMVIVFPVLLILFLCVTGYKLARLSANADRLAKASEALLIADDVAAKQAAHLARSIRSEMSAVEDDMTSMSVRLKSVQAETRDYIKDIDGNVTQFSNKTEFIGQNLETQKVALDSLSRVTQDRMESLNSLIALRKASLEKATEQSIASLNGASQKFEQMTESFEIFTQDIENRIKQVSETLVEGQKESTKTVLALGEQTEVLHEKVLAMSAENASLKELFNEQISLMEDFTSVNTSTQNAFKDTLLQSRDAAENLKQEAQSGTDYLDKQRQVMKGALSETEETLEGLNRRIADLKRRADNLEGQQFSQAENIEMPLPIPTQAVEKVGAGRLQLRPLELSGDLTSDNEAVNPSEEIRRSTDKVKIVRPQVNGAFPIEEGISIPSLSSDPDQSDLLIEAETAQPNGLGDDLMRPVNPSRSLFGRTKKTEKSGWRWRDMIGGFDSSDLSDEALPESALDIVEHPSGKSFEAWLDMLDLNADAIISDGTILDYATALIDLPASAQTILDTRFGEISEYLASESETQPDIKQAAQAYRDSFEHQINTQIMNKESIRSRLNLTDGKIYLLARLT